MWVFLLNIASSQPKWQKLKNWIPTKLYQKLRRAYVNYIDIIVKTMAGADNNISAARWSTTTMNTSTARWNHKLHFPLVGISIASVLIEECAFRAVGNVLRSLRADELWQFSGYYHIICWGWVLKALHMIVIILLYHWVAAGGGEWCWRSRGDRLPLHFLVPYLSNYALICP